MIGKLIFEVIRNLSLHSSHISVKKRIPFLNIQYKTAYTCSSCNCYKFYNVILSIKVKKKEY